MRGAPELLADPREVLGALRGEVGCGSVLNPGTVVGRGTNMYPLAMVRGYVPEGSIYKRQGEVVEKAALVL